MASSSECKLSELISPVRIQARVSELGREISPLLTGGEPWVVLGVLRGAFIFMADLVRSLTQAVEVDFMRISSYGPSAASSGRIRLAQPPGMNLRGRSVLLVDDILDTGLSLSWLKNFLDQRQAARVYSCVLLDKSASRVVPVTADYVGFAVPSAFLVGYGLDMDQKFRYLPGIYQVLPPDGETGAV
ncbi:MAG: hypoxanthine phosphoribosyltransferase [Desulfarculales bacterium]|nr:hypoxanthine phosphoribosyltransferase [Desulfarculales bacterium]